MGTFNYYTNTVVEGTHAVRIGEIEKDDDDLRVF
jgi:hypothetical protein